MQDSRKGSLQIDAAGIQGDRRKRGGKLLARERNALASARPSILRKWSKSGDGLICSTFELTNWSSIGSRTGLAWIGTVWTAAVTRVKF